MEPSTSTWINAFQELAARPELDRIVVHRGGDWSFVAERQSNPKTLSNKDKVIANTYYKTKIYKTETFIW